MPSSSFLNHKERKHSMIDHVPYAKLLDDQVVKRDSSADAINDASSAAVGPLVKCRFCPNRIPKGTMERHLQRCHVECHLCGKTLLKSNRAKHIAQKHGNSSSSNGISGGKSSNLPDLAALSQSKSSMHSDSDESIAASDVNLANDFSSPAVQMPKLSYASSLSSASSTPSPTPPPPNLPSSSSLASPAVIQPPTIHRQSSPAAKENVIHVDIWQLSRYIRQGRVYNSNGCLYLRNATLIQCEHEK